MGEVIAIVRPSRGHIEAVIKDEIVRLWVEKKLDTYDICEKLRKRVRGVPLTEAMVYNTIGERKRVLLSQQEGEE